MHSNIGYIVTLALNLSLLLPRATDPRVNNYVLVLYVDVLSYGHTRVLTIRSTNGYWVLLGIWWCEYPWRMLDICALNLTVLPQSSSSSHALDPDCRKASTT